MEIKFSKEDEQFRQKARDWLESRLSGDFRDARGRGGPGDEHSAFELRLAWERRMGEEGWTCLGWPKRYGGQNASLSQQIIWFEEYARARAPGRVGHIGEGLLGPTLIAHGTEAQRNRFLSPIAKGHELWCQGYSEPDAGSDLASVRTRAEKQGDQWVLNGQKVWTSLAQWSDWCFVLCRTDANAPKHQGISYLLVSMKQPEVEIRPILQMTGTSEFSEVYFHGTRTPAENVVGEVHGGWKIAMATLAFERGASTLAQQLNFRNELDEVFALARRSGASRDPVMRQRLAGAWMGLQVMQFNAFRMFDSMQGGTLSKEALISKLFWATWHRDLGKLAMDVLGEEAEMATDPDHLTPLQRLFLFTRADTIYAGSNEIQRNIIGERALGLPKEPR